MLYFSHLELLVLVYFCFYVAVLFCKWCICALDCWKCSEESIRQFGAGSSEGSIWKIRWRQRGGEDEVCGWNCAGNAFKQHLILKPVSVALKNKCVHSGAFTSFIVSEICPSYPLAHTSLVTSFTNNFSFSFFSTAGHWHLAVLIWCSWKMLTSYWMPSTC